MNMSWKIALGALLLTACVIAPIQAQTAPKSAAPVAISLAGFPNTPEGAYKALVYAMSASDEAAIMMVTVNTPGLGRLLETTRVPAKNLPAIREHLLKRTDVQRLAVGDTVRMAGGEIYAVKASDADATHAVVRDGAGGTMPIRCRLENGGWKVDARLIIANRRVAGVTEEIKSKGVPKRDIVMPSPLTGPPYPNTPEGAARTFMVAYLTADAPNLHAVALPGKDFDALLKRPPCSFAEAAKYQAEMDRHVFKSLKPGETIDVNGRTLTITAKEITPTRALVSVDLPGFLPMPCDLIDGKWWVDPRPVILSLKTEEKAKTAAKSTAATR